MLNLTQNTEVNRTELPPLPRPQNLGYTRGTCAAPLSHFWPCGAVACLIGVFRRRPGAPSMQTPGICPPLHPQHLEQNVSCEEMDESNRASWQQALSAEPLGSQPGQAKSADDELHWCKSALRKKASKNESYSQSP